MILHAPNDLIGIDKLVSDHRNLMIKDSDSLIESPYHNNFLTREMCIKPQYMKIREIFTGYRHVNFVYKLLKLWLAKIVEFRTQKWRLYDFDIDSFLHNVIASILHKLGAPSKVEYSPLMVVKTILESLSKNTIFIF